MFFSSLNPFEDLKSFEFGIYQFAYMSLKLLEIMKFLSGG